MLLTRRKRFLARIVLYTIIKTYLDRLIKFYTYCITKVSSLFFKFNFNMQNAGFLGFCIIYMQMFLLNANPEYPVEAMNDTFNNPGWIKWHQTEGIRIVEHWMDVYEEFNAYDLLRPSTNGRIVTNGNVARKIRQAYQFLSCKYANVLDEFCEYERGMCTACMRMNNPSESWECLGVLIKMFKKSDSLVMCMQGSLSCLHQLSPQNVFNTEIFEILEDLKNVYRNKTFKGDSIAPSQDVMSTVAKEVALVEKEMSATIKQVSAFYNSNCRPTPREVQSGKTPKFARRVNRLNEIDSPNYVMIDIKRYIKKDIIDLFIRSFNENFGFRYNLESKETVLMYDANLLERVERMNHVFAKPAWSELNKKDIIFNGNRVAKELLTSVDGKIVTKANVDEKTQEAHRLLSCKYAEMLKRCCDYATVLWKLYSKHSSNPSSYLDIMVTSEPLISRMKNALFHFYQLSPHIEYKRIVHLLLEKFSNSFKTEVFKKKNSLETFFSGNSYPKIIKRKLNIEKDMNDISNNLFEFYSQNCFAIYINSNLVEKENVGVTSSNLKEKFAKEINCLMSSNYEDFGFPFDTISKMKNKGIITA